LKDFGCFVEILPGTEGMCHVSELDTKRVEKVEDVVKIGDILKVKVIGMEDGKIRLSHKAVIMEERGEKYEPRDVKPRGNNGGGGGRPPRR